MGDVKQDVDPIVVSFSFLQCRIDAPIHCIIESNTPWDKPDTHGDGINKEGCEILVVFWSRSGPQDRQDHPQLSQKGVE